MRRAAPAVLLGGRRRLRPRTGSPVDRAKAQGLYEKACTGGQAADCRRAGELLLADNDTRDADKGDLRSAKTDKSAPRDEARARALLEKGCKAGEELACAVLDAKGDAKAERKSLTKPQ